MYNHKYLMNCPMTSQSEEGCSDVSPMTCEDGGWLHK